MPARRCSRPPSCFPAPPTPIRVNLPTAAGVHARAQRLVTELRRLALQHVHLSGDPEMIGGMSDSCQWFKSQFDPLMGQINDFNRHLGDHHDDYTAGGMQRTADAVVANIDRSTAFLGPRVKPLIITNEPDNFGPYSPLYGGNPWSTWHFSCPGSATASRERIRRASPTRISSRPSAGRTRCVTPAHVTDEPSPIATNSRQPRDVVGKSLPHRRRRHRSCRRHGPR